MYLFVVFETLLLHIVLQHSEVSILTYRVDVVPHRPEVAAPQEFLHLWMFFKKTLSGDAFDEFYHTGNTHVWNCLYQKVSMVAIYTYF